jgi:hypothetical protein
MKVNPFFLGLILVAVAAGTGLITIIVVEINDAADKRTIG